ncbi:MAG: cation:proton antiporter [Chloroflexi bacterium]|nr:cation:proton antiporter [Chloroflexota bacterium]
METEIINGVIISIVAAAILAYLTYRLRQPVILGYMIAGIVIGPQLGLRLVTNPEAINFSSELGLVALLFMVGLELDLGKIVQSGKGIIIGAIAQFVICAGLGLAFFSLPGFSGGGKLAVLYLAITFSLSSTMIVVKLLYDKSELDTLPGRISLGILVLQDVWAILFLAIQPSLAKPEIGTLALSFVTGAGLVASCLLASRFLLPRLFKSVVRNPELMVVMALGWAFLVSWLFGDFAGLSRAMGALVAGVSLSTLPYKEEITDRVTTVRSFFLILFFVSLGMKVSEPSLSIFLMSLLASLFLIASRFISIFPILYFLRKGIRVSFLVPLNLAQISEFALVIGALGVSFGHINESVMTVILFTLMITAAASTYMITYSHSLYLLVNPILKMLGLKDIPMAEEQGEQDKAETYRPILFLGFYKIASFLLHSLEKQDPAIRDKIAVVDFNPEVCQELRKRGVSYIFGDLGNTGTLAESGLDKARIVVSSIPDTILKGTSNMALLTFTKRVNKSARVIVTAESIKAAQELWAAGADFVIVPHIEASDKLAPVLQKLLTGEDVSEVCAAYRQQIMEHKGGVIE